MTLPTIKIQVGHDILKHEREAV